MSLVLLIINTDFNDSETCDINRIGIGDVVSFTTFIFQVLDHIPCGKHKFAYIFICPQSN